MPAKRSVSSFEPKHLREAARDLKQLEAKLREQKQLTPTVCPELKHRPSLFARWWRWIARGE